MYTQNIKQTGEETMCFRYVLLIYKITIEIHYKSCDEADDNKMKRIYEQKRKHT